MVIPKCGQWRPGNDGVSLSRLAKDPQLDLEKFTVFESKAPVSTGTNDPQDFGGVFVLRSLKNFVIEQDGSVIFMCYKSSDATCSLKIRDPITPFLALLLAIAIVLG
jgi:hypothetical protein